MSTSRPLLAFAAILAALLFPGAAQALELKIVNEHTPSSEPVYVTITGTKYVVPGVPENTPMKLSELPDPLKIEEIESGRVYVSYGAPVTEPVLLNNPTRFDWMELTVTPAPADTANLTAVDQFGIGMRLTTLGPGEAKLGEMDSANSDTIFGALQSIPGGNDATVRDSQNRIVRVVSPKHSSAYPDLGDYVRSLAGQSVQLHTAFFGSPFDPSHYTGTFAPDGTITVTGDSLHEGANKQITFPGDQLIHDVYTDEGTGPNNNLESAIKRDILVGFSAGFWGGKYGNDTLDFCNAHNSEAGYEWCTTNFDRPAYGDARTSQPPYATCNQYAAVIGHYADSYGDPYSDGSQPVLLPIAQPGHGGEVETLQMTLLPDSGNSMPDTGVNPNCGAGPPVPPAPPARHAAAHRHGGGLPVRAKLRKRAKAKRHRLRLGRVACSAACGTVRVTVRKGKHVLARAAWKHSGRRRGLVARLTHAGRRLLRGKRRKLKARLDVWVRPSGQAVTHRHRKLVLIG